MKISELKGKAKKLKIKDISKMKKDELIRAIQKAEGHNDCFKKIPDCCQMDCCFRDDCLQGRLEVEYFMYYSAYFSSCFNFNWMV